MICWPNETRAEKKQLEAISIFLSHNAHLVDFLFDPGAPKLNSPPEDLLFAARGLASGDFLLVRLALNIWCGSGGIEVHELFDAEPEVFSSILKSLAILAA